MPERIEGDWFEDNKHGGRPVTWKEEWFDGSCWLGTEEEISANYKSNDVFRQAYRRQAHYRRLSCKTKVHPEGIVVRAEPKE